MAMGRSWAKAVALLALITVISSAQCLNFCAVHPCNETPPVSAPVSAATSGHHSPAESTPEPTKQQNDCSHQPLLLTEKAPSVEAGALLLSSVPLAVRCFIPLHAHSAVLVADAIGSPPTEPFSKTVVLRI